MFFKLLNIYAFKLKEFCLSDNFWQHTGTAGLNMSCSNADAVRLKAKQHPCVSFPPIF